MSVVTRKIRTKDIYCHSGYRGNDEGGMWLPKDGERRYLIEVKPVGGSVVYILSKYPGRTNSSHAERLDGWLGQTDNVNRDARGYYEVVGRSRTHLHLRRLDG
jgi:hypothetical protein